MINTLRIIGIVILVIGLLMLLRKLIFFPWRPDVAFRRKVAPLLPVLMDYFRAVMSFMLDHTLEHSAEQKKIQLQQAWRGFPAWVFKPGFSPLLQQGHRYFLVRVEQLRQSIYALHYLARYDYAPVLLSPLKAPIKEYVAEIEKIMQALTAILTLQSTAQEVDDLSVQFDILENEFKAVVPLALDVLDIKPDYVHLANVINELKEFGKLWLMLAKTLR